jgi:hypothetical protein
MKHRIIVVAAMLAVGVSAPALAQPSDAPSEVRKIHLTGPKPNPAPTPQAAAADKAPFGCDVRAPSVCHFQIFYQRGGRAVVLAAGMKTTVPEVKVGSDGYCVAINKPPSHKCARKTINATYNN